MLSTGALPVARLVNALGEERIMPPMTEVTVGRMSTAGYVVESLECSRHQCSLTYVPPDHVVFVQKGSNSTKIVRAGADPKLETVYSTKPGGLTTDRLRHMDKIIVPVGIELTVSIPAVVQPANDLDQADTLLSDASDAESIRTTTSAGEVDHGVEALEDEFEDGFAVLSDESDDIDPIHFDRSSHGDSASLDVPAAPAPPVGPSSERVAPPDGRRARPARSKRSRVVINSDSDGDTADTAIKTEALPAVPTVADLFPLFENNQLHTLTAPVLRSFLLANGVDVKMSARKADLLMHTNLFLSGAS